MARVLFTSGLHGEAMGRLASHDIEEYGGPLPMPRDMLLEAVRGAEGLVCFPFDVIDSEVVQAAARLRTISTYSVGYDHIDLGAAAGAGISVGYTPDVLTDATADLAFALMIDVMRRVTEGDRMIRRGGWSSVLGAHEYVGADLRGKKLGIIGMGRIGGALASRASAFGMDISCYSRRRVPDAAARHATFDELVSGSDVVSLHVPHTPDTENMIDARVLDMMRPDAYLVNTSRGAVVNERDLADALRRRTIAGAALDVFCSEPIGAGHPLAGLENVVLSPHIGSSTAETRHSMADITVENLERGLAGRKLLHEVPVRG